MGMRQKGSFVHLALCPSVQEWHGQTLCGHRHVGWAHLETSREGLTWAGVDKKTKGSHGGSWGCGPLCEAGPSLQVSGLL